MRMSDLPVLLNPLIGFFLNGRSTFLGDCPGHTASVQQALVRGVDDRIHFLGGDVASNDLDFLTCKKNVFCKNRIHLNIVPR